MIDVTNGTIDFGNGKMIYHGMTKEEFFESKIYKVRILVHFSLVYVEEVEIDCPEMSNYLEWPDDYDHYTKMFECMNRYNHEILEEAFNTQIKKENRQAYQCWMNGEA